MLPREDGVEAHQRSPPPACGSFMHVSTLYVRDVVGGASSSQIRDMMHVGVLEVEGNPQSKKVRHGVMAVSGLDGLLVRGELVW